MRDRGSRERQLVAAREAQMGAQDFAAAVESVYPHCGGVGSSGAGEMPDYLPAEAALATLSTLLSILQNAPERRETAPIRDAQAETVVPPILSATGHFRGGGL